MSNYRQKLSYFLCSSLAALLFLASPLQASDFVVNNTGDGSDEDSTDSICEVTDGEKDCTLRAAIDQANAAIDEDTITFDASTFPAGEDTTISTASALVILTAMTITGPGADTVTVKNDGSSRVFMINQISPTSPAGPHNISGLTVTGGDGGVGIISTEEGEKVTLDSVVITENTASTSGGGVTSPSAIDGSVTIKDSTCYGFITMQGRTSDHQDE